MVGGGAFGLLPGALRQLELIYVFGDEEDLLTTRAIGRGARIEAYPVRAAPDFIRSLFLDLAQAANRLREEPRFYGSLRQNCTTTLVRHIDGLREGAPIGLRAGILFPRLSGKLLADLGYLDSDLPYEEAEEAFRIDQRVRQYAGNAEFSQRIRKERIPLITPFRPSRR